ncbi:MAG: ABC transporter substrate-binding protein [Defluviitaleaceae bacterium]|nr:ABC transporter substrate-binding protein [Defluviitaleaceae bacterium]
MKKRSMWLALLAVAFLLFLTACGTDEDGSSLGEVVDPTEADNGDEVSPAMTGGEIVYVVASDVVTLDPIRSNDSASTDAQSQMLDGLTRFDPVTAELLPRLATSFEQIEPTVWEFSLRQGIYFTDGAYFDADVVALNLNRLLDPEEASPALFIVEMITEVEVVDTYTVHIHTEFPFAPLPGHLAHRSGFMVSPNAIAATEVGEDVEPVGTGPFILSDREYGNFLLMERNDAYWGSQLAIPDYVRFIVVPEPATRFAMVQTGEAHYLVGQPTDFAVASDIDSIDVDLLQTTTLDYIGFNTAEGPLANVLVRQAITHAIDRNAIVEGLAEGVGLVATGPLAPLVDMSPTVEGLDFDLELARALLEESGYTDIELNFWYNEGNNFRGLVGVFVQASLAEIGITVNVASLEWGAYLEATAAGEHDMFMLGWVTTTGDPDYGLFPILHSDQVGDPGNRFFFENDEVDALLARGRQSSDRAYRMAVYQEVAELLVYEAPMVPLRFQQAVLLSNGVDGILTDFANTPFFYRATLRPTVD